MGEPGTPPSSIMSLVQDEPLEQDDDYTFDDLDRSYIDSQALGAQYHLLQSLLLGKHCTWVRLDPTSAAASQGDGVTSAGTSTQTVTRALASPLAASGSVYGVVIQGGAPGAMILVALTGIVPAILLGLSGGGGIYARINTGTARVQATSSLSSGDYPVGTLDAVGNLTLIRSASFAAGRSVQRVAGTASVQALPNGIVYADPGGGTPGSPTVLAPTATQGVGDGDEVTVKDTSNTANNTTQKIGFTPGAGQQAEDPQSPGTYSSSTVFIVQPSDARTWAWDLSKAHWTLI